MCGGRRLIAGFLQDLQDGRFWETCFSGVINPTKLSQKDERTTVEKGGPSKEEYMGTAQETERNKLVFFEGSQYTFDLEDLLRASAEVLGKGSVGTAYKAVLEDGTTVVVKRLKDVAVNRRDFEQQMELVGRIRHRNLVPLRAFYFSKDEKLLVYDYMPTGSLSALLHGSRGSGRTPLDWETRMRMLPIMVLSCVSLLNEDYSGHLLCCHGKAGSHPQR